MENIIVDEAHNLVEKGYDFFSEEIEYNALRHFLKKKFIQVNFIQVLNIIKI